MNYLVINNRKVLKIIVYLHDINEDNGAFQYLPISFTSSVGRSLKYDHGYIQDPTMQKVISPSYYKSCLGSAGTVVFAATSSIFHWGKIPISSDRLSLFFDYTSRFQKQSFYGNLSLPNEDLILLFQNISEQQREYLFWQQNS